MVYLSNRQVAEIAADYGHDGLTAQPTKRGTFVATCSCGYRSAQRRTQADAAEAAAHHMLKAVRAVMASGAPLPRTRPVPEGKGSLEPAAAA